MKKRIISIIAAVAMLVTALPTSFAENASDEENVISETEITESVEETENDEQEEIIQEENSNEDEQSEDIQEDVSENIDVSENLDIQPMANFSPRTSSPNGNKYWYSNLNVFYSAGFVGECTWYAWGRAYEILGSRPNLPTNGAGRWFSSCNSYPKSTNYYAAKVGAIACYSGHVAVVEAVGSNGAPSAISEGGYRSSSTYGQIVQPINGRGDRYFHYGKDYTGKFQGYIYILNNADSGTGAGSNTHTHSWSYYNESAHPHRQYRQCSCGAKEYTGATQHVGSCSSCYPLGYVNLTRSFDRIKKNVTFYRNNVSNGNSFTLTLYKDGRYYNDYSMNSTQYYLSNLPSGTYTATLYVRNTSTGQSKNVQCSSFTIVDSYTVQYNANGGTNAPASQTKIKDEAMRITSSIPKKVGHIFKGWASSRTATEPQYQTGGTYTRNTPITMYAVWEPEIYTITFDTKDGKGDVPSTKITYGNTMKMPNNVVKEGYYLKGWSKTPNGQTVDYRIGLDYSFTQDTTLYAVWGQSTWSGEVAKSFAGGDGTKDNPYQISNSAELAYFANKINQQSSEPTYEYYKLTDNIGLNYDEWTPIGVGDYDNQYFYGSFDGNGYTISDLSISNVNSGNIGLFGTVKNSEIKGLTLLGEITGITTSSSANIGALAGYSENTSISECSVKYVNISNISTSDSVYSNVGCLVGKSSDGEIKECNADESNAIVKQGSFNIGIICGLSGSTITDCRVTSEAELFETGSGVKNVNMGGLCGQQTKNVEKCTVNAGKLSANNLSITNDSNIGGLVGNVSGKVNLCTVKFTNDTKKTIDGEEYSISISVNSKNSYIGGIAGNFAETAKITDCMYDGKSISSETTSGTSQVGGLVGRAKSKTTKSVSAQGGQSLSRSSLPTRDGYVATWYTDSNLTKEYDFSQPVTADMTLYAKWTEGKNDIETWDGTSSEPKYNADTKTYTVTNGKELAWVSDVTNGVIISGTNFPNDKTFKDYTIELANDIYLNDTSNVSNWSTSAPKNSWKPIGTEQNKFDGFFNGNNFSIHGIYYNSSNIDNVGLFGYLNSNSTLESVGIKNSYIYSEGEYVGSIAGYSNGEILKCSNFSEIKGGDCVGGIVGCSGRYSQVTDCLNNGNVSGNDNVGGIVGYIVGKYNSVYSRIDNCYNIGSISAANNVGGVVGQSSTYVSVSKCYNLGTIKGKNNIGGIVGRIANGTFSYCYSNSSISGTGNYVAGIAGILVGQSSDLAELDYCYSNYSPLYKEGSYYLTKSVSYKSSSSMKSLSNLSGFSSSDWGIDSSINNGYPYLKSLEDTYKTYKVTVIEDVNDSAAINRSFSNIDGMLFSNNTSGDAYAGGVIGYGYGTKSDAKNLLGVANKISSKTTGSSYKAYSGDIIGYNSGSAFVFDTVFSNSSLDLSAVNSTTSSNVVSDRIGNSLTDSQLKRASTLKRIFGPNTYESLEHLKEDPTAVWVVKDGELPELYYNVLNNITLDKVENGEISVDKTQAVNGEIVTVAAKPSDNYQLNKIYVNGNEITGNTFEVDGDSKVFATFSEKTPEYNVKVKTTNNATASVLNVDSIALSSISMMAGNDSISAKDGDEIQVNTTANTDYTVDAVYVNGEEMQSDSFIVTADSVVTMDVASISTDVQATTNYATDIGNYFATLSGSVSGENADRYIRYWAADNPDEVYVTEVQSGSGDYSVEVTNLLPETEYRYQMNETGEVKTFVTRGYYTADGDDGGDVVIPTTEPVEPIATPTVAPTPTAKPTVIPTDEPVETVSPTPVEPSEEVFEIKNASVSDKVRADVVNVSDKSQSGILIFVAYTDDDKLLIAEKLNIDNVAPNYSLPCSFDIPNGASKYKLFVWKSFKNLIPLAQSVNVQ